MKFAMLNNFPLLGCMNAIGLNSAFTGGMRSKRSGTFCMQISRINTKNHIMIRIIYLGSLMFLFLVGCKSTYPEIQSANDISANDILEPNWKTDTCSVHNEKLIEAIEPLFLGKLSFGGDYLDARKKFPYAWTNMQHNGPEHYWRVRYCPVCRESLAAWVEKRNQEP